MTIGAIISVLVCLTLLGLRMLLFPPAAKPSSNRQRIKTARLLFNAALALAAIFYTLQRLSFNLDGKAAAPSFMERIVMAFSK